LRSERLGVSPLAGLGDPIAGGPISTGFAEPSSSSASKPQRRPLCFLRAPLDDDLIGFDTMQINAEIVQLMNNLNFCGCRLRD
jgi:hypothetical protein